MEKINHKIIEWAQVIGAATLISIMLLCLISILTACTQYDTPEPIAGGTENATEEKLAVKRYVLWINIDGARGSVVKELAESGQLPNIASMLPNAKYSWTGLSDMREKTNASDTPKNEDAITWASMLTGVSSAIHMVKDDSYSPDFVISGNGVNQKVNYYSSLVQVVGNATPNVRISVISPYSHLNRYLGEAHTVVTTSSDNETFTSLEKQLSENENRLFIVGCSSVDHAGQSGGYSSANQAYTAALKDIDERIGVLLDIIKNHENHYYEDWLVVISSNHGGNDAGEYTGVADEQRDIFGIFYYPYYSQQEMKGEKLNAILFSKDNYAEIRDSTAYYSAGHFDNFSFDFTIKMVPKEDGTFGGNNWDRILGKTSGNWAAFRQRSTVKIYCQSSTGGIEQGLTICNDALWHSIYMGLGDMTDYANRDYVFNFDGGTQALQGETSCIGAPKDSTNITIGGSSMPTSFYSSTFRIWKKRHSSEIIQEIAKHASIENGNSLHGDLIGEWIMSPEYIVNDSTISNTIEGKPDLIFPKGQKPVFVSIPNTLPDKRESGNLMMENTLIAPQIVYWLCGASYVPTTYESPIFIQKYALEEQWRDAE